MKNIVLLLLLLISSLPLSAQYTPKEQTKADQKPQTEEEVPDKVYRVNPWISGGITVLGVYTNSKRFDKLQDKDILTAEEIALLDPNDVPRFDRVALRQDLDKVDGAAKISDKILMGSVLLPAALFLNKKIRKDWLDITIMYVETQAIASNVYSWGPVGPSTIDRLRPRAYYVDLPLEEKESGGTRNSFFSGHVSSVATGTFFFAKVYSDYHPEMGAKHWIFYSLAAVPPTVVAHLRVKALKHFPSDTIVGGLIGASLGYFIPQIHKTWQRKHRSKLNVNASYGANFKGGGFSLTF